MKDIILYGTGAKGRILYQFLHGAGRQILFWVDSDSTKWGTELFGKKIYAPEEILKYPENIICISAIDPYNEIYNKLLNMGISKDSVFNYNEIMIQQVDKDYNDELQKIQLTDYTEKSILVDCIKGLSIGGIEEWSKSLVSELANRGHHAYLVAPTGDYDISDKLKKNILYSLIDRDNLFSQKNIIHIINSIKEYLPCIVITGSVNPFFIAACILKNRFPQSITIISVIHMGSDDVYKEYIDVFSYIDKLVSVSKDIQKNMIKRGVPANQILHMTCPVECDEKLIRKYSEENETSIHLAYAGRIEVGQKRMDLLILLIDELEHRKVNYHFEIAGTGSYLEEMKLFVSKNNLAHKVIFIGKIGRDRIAQFWKEQDVCINIADYEGRSISIMEAMANGAVPIVTMTSGVQEDIVNGVNGYFVDVGDYKIIADKIQYLSENRHLLKIMGSKAHSVISGKSDMNKHMEFWEQILSTI